MEYPWPVKETNNLVSPSLITILNNRASIWLDNRKFYQIVGKLAVDDIQEYNEYERAVMSNLLEYSLEFPNSRYDSRKQYKLNSTLVIASPWFRQIRHKDSSDKVFSFVTYLNEQNLGTKIHSSHRWGNTVTVPWVQGKTIVFAPGDNTWHSWSSNSNWRVTLISFVTQTF